MLAVQCVKSIPAWLVLKSLGHRLPYLYTNPFSLTRLREVPEPKVPTPRWVRVRPLLDRVEAFADLISLKTGEIAPHQLAALRMSETTGRPLGETGFVERLEAALGRRLRPAKRGRKPHGEAAAKMGEK